MEFFAFMLILLQIYLPEMLVILAVVLGMRYLFSLIYLFVRRIDKMSEEKFDKKSN